LTSRGQAQLQDHLRDRLTGAAIVVVVVVLLVPELFHGRPATDSGTGTTPAAGPPVRSYTIDLRDSAGGQQPAVASPVVPTAPGAATGGSATPAPTPSAAVAPAATAPAATAPAAAAHATTDKSAPPVSIKASAPAAPSAHGSATQSGWVVQVGSFSQRDHAERMVKDLAAKGFTVEVAGPDDHGLFRVRSPPHAERAAANVLRQKMQASGLKPLVSRVP
jgi:cell division septation protein DedD